MSIACLSDIFINSLILPLSAGLHTWDSLVVGLSRYSLFHLAASPSCFTLTRLGAVSGRLDSAHNIGTSGDVFVQVV